MARRPAGPLPLLYHRSGDMATQRQIEANRRNARRSTGPRTAGGKARASRNAAKGRLLPCRMLIPGESRHEYDALLRTLERNLKPHDAIEGALVRQIADAEWRLNRAVNLETGILSERFDTVRKFRDVPLDRHLDDSQRTKLFGGVLIQDAGADALSKLSRYETRLSRRYFTALARLEALQDRRRKRHRKSAKKSTKKK